MMVCVLRVTPGSAQISARVASGPMPASDSATATLTLAGKPAIASRALPSKTRSGSFSPSTDDAALRPAAAPGKARGRLARDDLDRGDLAFGRGPHRIEPEQRAGRHDDAGAGLAGALDERHVVDQRADRERHEDAPALDGRPGDGGEMLRGQAFDDDVGRVGKLGEADEPRRRV